VKGLFRIRNQILMVLMLVFLIGGCKRISTAIPTAINFLEHPEALVKADGIPEFDELIGDLTKTEPSGVVRGRMQRRFDVKGQQPSTPPLAGEHRNMRHGFKWGWTEPLAFKVVLPQAPILAFEWGFTGVDTERYEFKFTAAVSQGRAEKIVSELSGQIGEVSKDPNWGLEKVTLEGFHPGDALVTFKLEGVPDEIAEKAFILSAPRFFSSLKTAPRRVILIGVDTLRADDMSCYGYKLPTTPNIDKWSEGGTRYDYCVSACPWTFPSFSSILTGRYPSVCGAMTLTRFLPGAETTLAEILSKDGFTTFSIINSYLVSPVFNLQQGFDGVEHFEMGLCEGTFTRAREWLDAHKEEDIFLFIHLMDPHTPYQPPLEFGQMYYPRYDGRVLEEVVRDQVGNNKAGAEPLVFDQATSMEIQRALYDGEITYVDDQFGKFMQYLGSNGMEDGSLIVFCSDHGEEFLEHGGTGHGHSLYDEVLHVPLIILGPGIPSGQVVNDLIATVDIFPTILGFLNIKIPENLNGISLLSSNDSDRILISEELEQGFDQKGATTADYRYILHTLSGKEELYDLKDDKPMLASVAADRRSICRGFRTFLISYTEKLSSPWRIVFSASEQRNMQTTYSGSIDCPGGFASVEPYRFEKDDKYEVKGEVLSFELSFNDNWEKEIRFKSKREGVDIGFDFYRFGMPIGPGGVFVGPNLSPVNESSFTLNVNDPRFEFSENGGSPHSQVGIVIYAAPLRYREQVQPDLTPEMVEELRSLGYLN